MVNETQLTEMIKTAKAETKKRKFKQSLELIMIFKDIDVKKGFAINETVQLPKTSSPASVCIMASGDMGLKAKTAKADKVIDGDELNQLSANKRQSRKIGDETMADSDFVANASAVINAVEKKLPSGDKNVKRILIKTTMGKIVKESQQVKKNA